MIQENSPHLLKGASPLRGIDMCAALCSALLPIGGHTLMNLLVDSGTGASCIYPLLGAKIGGWSFLATDIDETSIGYARRNVTLNNLESSIELRKVNPDQMLLGTLPLALLENTGQGTDERLSGFFALQEWCSRVRSMDSACATHPSSPT